MPARGAHLRVVVDDAALVLAYPQHYHVLVTTYEQSLNGGETLTWSTEYDLMANDKEVAVSKAKQMSRKTNAHVKRVRQCPDPQHWEGIDHSGGS